jgi:glycosyltransferase involved in cell wall biosynthesis
MGGAETSLRELLASVRAAAPHWELILVLGEDGPMARTARDLGVRVMVIPFPPTLAQLGDARRGWVDTLWSLLKSAGAAGLYARRLAGVIRTTKPDLVHTNGFKMHLLGAWICPRKTPLVWHIHDYVSARPLMSRLLSWHTRRCAIAIVNSHSVGADLKALAPRLKIAPVYNAVDLERFAPTGTCADLDAIAGLPPAPAGTIRVGLVGTFARWKGHTVFLRALSLAPPGASIRGYIIGGPIYQTGGSQWTLQELQEEANQLGLGGRVGFTGFIDDVPGAMRSLDIIVHASTQAEPFGMVIIEGMACGRAVIASQAGGAEEIFEEGKDAVGHPPGDARALSVQILRLASDQGLRASLGLAGRAKTERLFQGCRLSQQVIAIYQGLANESFDLALSLKADVSAQPD